MHQTSIRGLFLNCSWDWPDTDVMTKAFLRSHAAFAMYADKELIGFGRIVSDGHVYGLLVDLMIAPSYRRQGLGRALVKTMLETCQQEGLKVIQLLSSKAGRHLYESCGFTPCPESSPGMVRFFND